VTIKSKLISKAKSLGMVVDANHTANAARVYSYILNSLGYIGLDGKIIPPHTDRSYDLLFALGQFHW